MTDSDIDLIRAAGKAAGLKLQLALGFTEHDRGLFTSEGKEWNPLTDDGDAFRLAVALRLTVVVRYNECEVFSESGDYLESEPIFTASAFVKSEHATDPAAATRRCIVRAAAAIGAKGE